MKVDHVIPSIEEEASGPSGSVPRLCKELLCLGLDVQLHSLGMESGKLGAWDYRYPRNSGPFRLGRSRAMYEALGESAKTVALLHNHSLWMMPNIYPRAVCNRAGIPWVVSPRGTLSPWALSRRKWTKKVLWFLLQGAVVKNAALLHAASEMEKADFRRLGLKNPVAVIPNGIDLPAFNGAHSPRGPRRLLFLGRVHPTKGIDLLLQAWSACASGATDWELVIAGPDGDGHLEEMKRMAKELGLPRVHFPGPVYGEAKSELLRNSDAFILPSRSESFGMAVAEALAHGIPVVVSPETPWNGVLGAGCGWVIRREVTDWSTGLRQVLASPRSELQAMGAKGRAWMERDFKWGTIADRMKRTYEWVLGGGSPPSWIET